MSDGTGAPAAGREAADIVVATCLEAIRGRGGRSWEQTFTAAIAAAQAKVVSIAERSPGPRRVSATAAIAVVAPAERNPWLHLAHVGDSRVYLCRGKAALYRLTTDHSLVFQLVRDGLLREDETFGHPHGNVLRRAVGQRAPVVEVEIQTPLPLDAGDVVLVCSDGLHAVVPERTIGELLARPGSAAETCGELLAAAVAARHQDDVTIGCVRVVADCPRLHPTRVEI